MPTSTIRPLANSLDIIFLGTLGLGTIAWLARHHLADALFTKSSFGMTSTSTTAAKPTTSIPVPAKETNFVKIMKDQGRRVIFFYGSQTGTAEDYASRLAKECKERYGVNCMTADIEHYDLSYLDTVPNDCLVFFVMATYGEGEPTDNAAPFWELLQEEEPLFAENRSSENPLDNLRYSVFGLGNKTYEHYNAVGRVVDRRLTQLGATRIGDLGEGDDDGSLEEDFLAWQATMWPKFCSALGVDESSQSTVARQPVFKVDELEAYDEIQLYLGEMSEHLQKDEKPVYGVKRPFLAPVRTRSLFRHNERHCLHVDMDLSGSGMKYRTGDHVAMMPINSDDEVNRLASVLGLTSKLDTVIMVRAIDPAASKQHPFPVPTTYRVAFRHYLDICAVPSRQALMTLVEFAPDACKERLHTLATDRDEYRLHVTEAVRSLGQVLEWVAGSESSIFNKIPFDVIVESTPRLQPRYYSISSTPVEGEHSLSATAVVLDYQPETTRDRTVFGVHTNYLWHLHSTMHKDESSRKARPIYDLEGPRQSLWDQDALVAKVPVHIRRSQFKLPMKDTKPIIMVGPGTGVAPFRAFVRERAWIKQQGKEVGSTILFYGCRNSQQDFLYDDEWPALFATLGEGSKLITAFSRETDEKVYVQDRLQEHGKEMWDLLQQGAYVYVCGDAKKMARDVNLTFIGLAQRYGDKNETDAENYVKDLRKEGRYQEDVWS